MKLILPEIQYMGNLKGLYYLDQYKDKSRGNSRNYAGLQNDKPTPIYQ